jgi:hypothetical protein
MSSTGSTAIYDKVLGLSPSHSFDTAVQHTTNHIQPVRPENVPKVADV